MTLPVYLAAGLAEAPDPVGGSELTLGEDVAGHAVRVRRTSVGEHLQVTDGQGLRVTGEVTGASAAEMTLRVTEVGREPAPARPLVLVQALAKQDRDLQAIEAATEVGVDAVVPWAAQRSIADWPAKKAAKSAAKWDNMLRGAALQARRTWVPTRGELVRGTALADTFGPDDLVLVLHESAETPLATVLAGEPAAEATRGRIVLVVGPEGGITEAELEAFTAAGARPVRLGPTVLRASSAGPVALAVVQTLLGTWS
ncbi:16S rRNA (uracil(1498)-N(3))-methyltransferase [Brevibacterium litoralis]|uniref:16S rRNA (uracil(1498)-N(3))-methyltransferase n=1 Tax=Brevibacterium litoralis TaxID=3138935 RepID=UPI0032ED25C3